MLIRILFISLISFPAVFSQPEYIAAPDWFENPSVIKGKFHVYGSGELRMEAILVALVHLERLMHEGITTSSIEERGTELISEFESVSNIIRSGPVISKLTNGLFNIEGLSEDIFKETGEDLDSEIYANFEEIQILSYMNGERSAQIESLFKETGEILDSELFKNFTAVYKNTDESQLIAELERFGFRFKYGLDKDGTNYVSISIDEQLLNSTD